MYRLNFHYKQEIEWERETKKVTPITDEESTVIEARFRFRGEYPPENEESVRRRAYPSRKTPSRSPLGIYLHYVEEMKLIFLLGEGLRLNTLGREPYTKGILRHPFFMKGPGFDLRLEVPDRKAELADIIDFDALNRFILTGDIPERIKDWSEVRTYLLPEI